MATPELERFSTIGIMFNIIVLPWIILLHLFFGIFRPCVFHDASANYTKTQVRINYTLVLLHLFRDVFWESSMNGSSRGNCSISKREHLMPSHVAWEYIEKATGFFVFGFDIEASATAWTIANFDYTAWSTFRVFTWNHFKLTCFFSLQLSIRTTRPNVPPIQAFKFFKNNCSLFPPRREGRWYIVLKAWLQHYLVPFFRQAHTQRYIVCQRLLRHHHHAFSLKFPIFQWQNGVRSILLHLFRQFGFSF
mmetsp:Transcript_36600/g.79024  ORF Transcript_36600/g.79024 Transcript_36600/m.79024 type:complete len:249 (-) Transcript_36600:216-962(-)